MSALNDVIDGLVTSVISNATDANAPMRKTIIDESLKSMRIQRVERTTDVVDRCAKGLETQQPHVQKAYAALLTTLAEINQS